VAPLVHAAGPAHRPGIYVAGGSDGETAWFLSHLDGVDLAAPVYGINAHGWVGRPTPTTVEQIAADFAAVIRGNQPHGPYRLAGCSDGGAIVPAMAETLESQGETVGRVLVVDPPHASKAPLLDMRDVVAMRWRQLKIRLLPPQAGYFPIADQSTVE